MFNWLKSKKQARIEQLERQNISYEIELDYLAADKKGLEKRINIIESAHSKHNDTLAIALGQTGKPFSDEKVYLIKFLNVYYKWKEVAEIINAIYQTNHSPDTIRKAAKRGAK